MMTEKQVKKIITAYGSPIYVFQKEAFILDYQRLLHAFQSIYPQYQIAYSYKTNYTPRICTLVKTLGGYAEVVSDMEYSLAKKIGYENKYIIYNGPVKGFLMEEHLLFGGIVNIDNPAEAARVIMLAKENPGTRLTVGIRVNMDVGQGFISRFGMEAGTEEFVHVLSDLRAISNISIIGLHCHIGRSRTLEAWKKRAEYMLSQADAYFSEPPKFIDLGSGMFGNMELSLAQQFGDALPTFEDYAQVVASIFKSHYRYLPVQQHPLLLSEPGTTLISAHVDFISQITGIKTVHGKHFAILDCCIYNIGEMCRIKHLPITIVPCGAKQHWYDKITLSGYTCLEYDVIAEEYTGSLTIGDCVVIGNTGGYSNVSKPPFIAPNCPMIELDNGKTTVIKRAETTDDIFTTYLF